MEMKALCCDSYLLTKNKESLSCFSWSDFYEVIKVRAPTILVFLEACVSQSTSPDRTTIVGVCAAILVKERCPSASIVQEIISIV